MTAPIRPELGDRSLFPKLRPFAYLNHAAISAPSAPVEAAASEVLQSYAERGMEALMPWVVQREKLRASLGKLLGAPSSDIGLTPSTTQGVSALAQSIPWQAGDRVLLFEGEFPANVTPWQQAAEAHGLELCWVPLALFAEDEQAGLEAVERELRRGIRLVAVSFVQFRDGLRMPLARLSELAHAAGGELFVDAIQGAGVVPLDVQQAGVDYLAGGAHKWLMGLEGAGYLYVRGPLVKALRPRTAGWLSVEQPVDFLIGEGRLRYDKPIRAQASMFEGSSSNAVGFAAFGAALDLILELGVESIYDHVHDYLDLLEASVPEECDWRSKRAQEPGRRSGILSFELPDGVDVSATAAALRRAGVSCSTPDGLLRFAPHWPNSLDEVPRVVDAIRGLT